MAEYTCNQGGEGGQLGIYQKTLFQKKKKAKQLVLRLSKYTSHFLCKGLSPEKGCRSALPVHPTPTSPSLSENQPHPKCTARGGSRGLLSVEHDQRKRTIEKGAQRPQVKLMLPCSKVWSWLNKPYF